MILCLVLLASAPLMVVAWVKLHLPEELHLPNRPKLAGPDVLLKSGTGFRRDDPRWPGPFGGISPVFANTGSLVCSISSALSYERVDLDPARLHQLLTEAKGYTPDGRVNWDALRSVIKGRAGVEIPHQPGQPVIDQALGRGHPVIARIHLPSGQSHWVTIVGRRGGEYLVHDPLGKGSELEPLSKYDSDIHGIRIIFRIVPPTSQPMSWPVEASRG